MDAPRFLQPRLIQPISAEGACSAAPLYPPLGEAHNGRPNAIESNARMYSRRLPVTLKSGRGVWVFDTEGRSYIDCLAGAGALALGHSHPIVTEAILSALNEGVPLQTLDLATPLRDHFIDELFQALPPRFAAGAKIHFCGPSGADAVEAAIKLAACATGRRSLLCFRGAYHGMTSGALTVTGDNAARASSRGILPEVQFLPFPSDYRCPFGLGGDAGWQASARYIEMLLDDPNGGVTAPAAIILEAMQGEGGVNPAPDEWLRALRNITARRGILLIVDEVQTGVGRTGHMFACESAGIDPDVMVLSKAIGGGLPLAAIVYRQSLDLWKPGAHAGTFRGNQLGFAAGAAAIRHIRAGKLHLHAREMGSRLMQALKNIAARTPLIGDIRGRGLMIGAEIVEPDGERQGSQPPPPSPGLARQIQQSCLRRGLIVELGGRGGSVVRFLPPLIAAADEIDQIATRFGAAVEAVEQQKDAIP